MPSDPGKEALQWHLRTALNHLYEPRVLRAGPLLALFDLEGQRQDVGALQRLLTDAIEALRPSLSTPQDSGDWRAYQILRRRFTEQLPQITVAVDLGLSVRHLQREEKRAREQLGEYLWKAHRLADRQFLLVAAEMPSDDQAEDGAPTLVQELEMLRESDLPQIADVRALIHSAVETAQPLFQTLGVSCEVDLAADLSPALVRPLLIEQGLLSVLTAMAEARIGRSLFVTAAADESMIVVTLRGRGTAARLPVDDLTMARRLIELAGGVLTLPEEDAPETGLSLTICLPRARQDTVLLIDDNADALQLLERYLSGTHYRPISLRDPLQAIVMAEEVHPQAILIDVMMPGRDGWALLGQLRAHPQLQSAPIVVCTVLPQERLARTLGAAGFLRKPVSRATLLATLDQLLAPEKTAAP